MTEHEIFDLSDDILEVCVGSGAAPGETIAALVVSLAGMLAGFKGNDLENSMHKVNRDLRTLLSKSLEHSNASHGE